LVPIKIYEKSKFIISVFRCPICLKKYNISFPLDVLEELLELVKFSYFYCDVCGTDNFEKYTHGYEANLSRHRILMKCKKCKKLRAKIATNRIWNEIASRAHKAYNKSFPEIEEVVEAFEERLPSRAIEMCPECSFPLKPDHVFCDNCGLQIRCVQCNAIIPQNSLFCVECGTKLVKSVDE